MSPAPLSALRQRGRRDHLVVCGSDALALRMVEDLAVRYAEQVTVIMRSAERGHGPQIARLPGVRVVERPETDRRAFLEADLGSARGLALLDQDDLGNFHAALRAQEINPGLRLVISIFNTSLGERIRTFFADCAVLSESAMAAPSFVAAALGEPAPSHVRLSGRTLYVARREDVDAGHVVCGLAASDDAGEPDLTLAAGGQRRPGAGGGRRLARATRWPASRTGWPGRCGCCAGCWATGRSSPSARCWPCWWPGSCCW